MPRPTTLQGRGRRRFARIPRVELAVVLAAVAMAVLAPCGDSDAWLLVRMLQLHADPAPSESTVVVRVAPALADIASCPRRLAGALKATGIRQALLLPPAHLLCTPEGGGIQSQRAPPASVLRVVLPEGDVVGWRKVDDPGAASFFSTLKIDPNTWLVPRASKAIPSVDLHALAAGHVPGASLAGRLAIVELTDDKRTHASGLAAALASAREGGQRHMLATPWVAALSAALALSLGLFQRRGGRYLLVASVASAALLPLACWGCLLVAELGAPPCARLLAVTLTSSALLQLPRLLANRRALSHAADLIERAALMRSDGLHTIPDEDFWPRVGDLASQAHPADSVLVAELPPRKWHLKFWPYRGMGENIIQERRRDIRRTPYSNEEGTPDITVTRRYLVMEGTPTVVVPLIALGEVEGYVFLVGDSAERAYMASPEVARRLSQDLGLMLRRRRIAKLDERKWRAADGHATRGPGMDTAQLVEGAELALGDLRIFNTLLRNAPVGLLYADSFGHVRVLGSTFAHWLPARGVAVPPGAASAPLSPGTLMLGTILKALRNGDEAPVTLAQVSERDDGVRFEVPIPANDDGPEKLTVFTVRALQESAEGVTWTAGFVGTLTQQRLDREEGSDGAVRLPFDGAADTLSVKPVAELALRAARAAEAAAGRPVRMEPARELGHAIAYHRELEDALIDMLYDAALKDSSGGGPVMTLDVDGQAVTLHIVDVLFGLPTSALKRALLAPSDPPEGLTAFGRFVQAVNASHGRVEIREDDWGIQITAHLLRARPLVRPRSMRPTRPPGERRSDEAANNE